MTMLRSFIYSFYVLIFLTKSYLAILMISTLVTAYLSTKKLSTDTVA